MIIKGEVEIFQNHPNLKQTPLCTLSEGRYFGEQEFFSNIAPKYSAKSKDFSTILTIPRSSFIKVIRHQIDEDKEDYDYENFPMNEDFEKFNMFKDQLILEGICD